MQYLIARRENIRKSRGADLKKKVQDKLTDAYWNVFTRIESVEFMDQASRQALLHTAEMLGMNDDFRDNLRDACARKDIDEAIDRFSQTKDRKDMQDADALIGAFQQCRKVLWGKESSTFFQLERWLRLNHIVATETSWPDGSLVTQDLEEKMKSVFGTKVSIASKGKGKGKIEIEYYSDDELEHLFDMMMSIKRGE